MMTAEKKVTHTPTPWKVDQEDSNGHWLIVANNKVVVWFDGNEDELHQANAEFIVRAVNEYEFDQKRIIELEKKCEALLEASNEVLADSEIMKVAPREFTGKLDDLRKAVIKAEGK